jgi:DNA-binding response OmpR family regulator
VAKILVVDDDPDILNAVSIILESQGHEVKTALNGAEGLAKLKDESPDIMILDMLMPQMDGFEVCKTLQDPRWSKYKSMPIIILTSVREEASQRRYELETGLELDVDDYIEKPIHPHTLLERVNILINKEK